ncbi:hypothetical protein [Jiella pelagia]|uniref:Uncharacterized protein n=1 Tax=Jiella pelagia TaxID=2986949 RepID=A0ABY7C0R1_9HYPH|nr:hypothetical protein [Jiella pelagia]WAP69444.1 hypothetical protein OH818_04035 [Jiella pelagia]
MTAQDKIQFRSKRDRENEIDLVRNYRAIAIPAIAAASHASRKAAPAKHRPDDAATVSLIAAE